MIIVLILSVTACIFSLIYSIRLASGIRKMQKIGDINVFSFAEGPLVSVIVPACNEQENIEKSVSSLIDQEYENLEIIVINDRSTDHTAQVLHQLKERFPRIVVHEIVELPEGWMGKSHALFRGATLARGKYLVFTDADVILEKTTIARAVAYMNLKSLDHLTLVFKNITRGWLLNSLILETGLGLLFIFRPWMAKLSGKRNFVGIGAFNMVRSSVYREIGGHESFKIHPIDDMMLGRTIKEHGFLQDCLLAYDFVKIPWYDSVRAMIDGLQKNMFALFHYRVFLIPVVLFAIFVISILPAWGAILGDTHVQMICLVTLALRLVTFYGGLRLQGLPVYYLPGFFLTPYIFCYIILKSAIVTMRNNGIVWRGQHYALADLRKNKPFLY